MISTARLGTTTKPEISYLKKFSLQNLKKKKKDVRDPLRFYKTYIIVSALTQIRYIILSSVKYICWAYISNMPQQSDKYWGKAVKHDKCIPFVELSFPLLQNEWLKLNVIFVFYSSSYNFQLTVVLPELILVFWLTLSYHKQESTMCTKGIRL